MHQHRIWAEVSRSAFVHNLRAFRKAAGKELCAVVKADGYGHGGVEMARLCETENVRYLAVATAEEALRIREAGVKTPLLVLGYTPPEDSVALAAADISQTLFDLEQARTVSAALPAGVTLKVHLKLDTGMNRLGMATAAEIGEAAALPGFDAEGLFTHFSMADQKDDGFVTEQTRRFHGTVEHLAKIKRNFRFIHCENSGAVVNYNELPGNLARAGLALYGYAPGMTAALELRPVMRLCATIAQIRHLEAGETVSYGRHFTAEKPTDIAVLCCGYADGYHRSLSNRAPVLVNGRRARVAGNVCMDMMMADVTGIPGVKAGGYAVLMGSDGEDSVSAAELAELAGTIPYELLCAVSARVPRVYVESP